jgi:hypothetical protein
MRKKIAFAVLILIIIAAGFYLYNQGYTSFEQFLDIIQFSFFEQCKSLQTVTQIEIHGLRSSDLGELNQVINLSIILSYSPPPSEYNQDNPDECGFLSEDAKIIIHRENEPKKNFPIKIEGDSHRFEGTFKLTSDGVWRIQAERMLTFNHSGQTYKRVSRNPDNEHSFKVLTTEEIALLTSSIEPEQTKFWENPVLIASAVASAIAAFAVRIVWKRWKKRSREKEKEGWMKIWK